MRAKTLGELNFRVHNEIDRTIYTYQTNCFKVPYQPVTFNRQIFIVPAMTQLKKIINKLTFSKADY